MNEKKRKLPFKPRKKTPTIRQIKALKYMSQGNSTRKSLILAGYSMAVANRSTKFLTNRGVQNALLSLKEYVTNVGLNNQKIADKFKEWIDANHKVPRIVDRDDKGRPIYDYQNEPDYDTQIKTFDRWEKIMGYEGKGNGKVKRKLTIEEFINEDSNKEDSI